MFSLESGHRQVAPCGICPEECVVEQAEQINGDPGSLFPGVELISVEDEEAPSICGLMMEFVANFTEGGLSEEHLHEGCAQKLIMVSSDDANAGTCGGEVSDSTDDFAAGVIP
ncbi:MAG: hypothetical protein RL215_1217 [Planctomycetota bacterium]